MALRLALALAPALLLAACASSNRPVLGRPGPARLAPGAKLVMAERPLASVDGQTVRVADVRGDKGTLVIVTCNHCPWSKAWEGRLAALGNRYAKAGVGVIAVNPNDPAAHPEDGFVQMQERASELGLEFPYAVDEGGALAAALGATKTPEVFLFDAEDTLVYVGAVDDNANDPDAVEQHYLQDALDALVAGAPVQLKQTRALGCAIDSRGQERQDAE